MSPLSMSPLTTKSLPFEVDARTTATAIAAGRVALGAGFTLLPGLALKMWPGDGSHTQPTARFLARSTGVRDLALGLGTLLALRKGTPVRGWLEASMLADAGDAVAIVLGIRSLPKLRAALAFAAAAGAVVAGRQTVAPLG